ncbi:N-acetylmuramoyl-L-alanine amidase [Entomospira entomophila]|uniref:N-acetylmuramoyl-L-alanine amidase n=1 Tax=Entomospira entomophila TaxID=2719988 RepID=A0A968GB12_9SPIO|nr:N-acetylmuramoyl-L-alanine amidase [Entomospira entomophilus]NIZ41080.1 N-acetylmuramoyl-L-alanine amidase [Entomospira entomophilus]WDI35289.1 N-acetylmuramoyl-L-alanine amidase [Entomospira entomophilus]
MIHLVRLCHSRFCLVVILSLSTLILCESSLYGKTINAILTQTNAEFTWHSWLKHGRLRKGSHHVFFAVRQPYLIFSNGRVVPALIYYADGVLSFGDKNAQQIVYFLEHGTLPDEDTLTLTRRMKVIVIDAGHGGRDSGAIGQHADFSIKEKDITLAVSLRLDELLSDYFRKTEVMMTRYDDSYPTLAERVAVVNELSLADGEFAIFISIHANAALAKSARGFEVWHLPASLRRNIYQDEQKGEVVQQIINEFLNQEYIAGGRRLAEFIQGALSRNVGHLTVDRGLREEAWFVVKGAHTVAILVELGFVSHEGEARQLAQLEYQEKLAQALFEGIRDYIQYFEQ